ncbi:MAG: hypothetical protein ABWZ75_03965 [Novosphingobium sp.]
MKPKNNETADRTVRRSAIERAIAHYPNIPDNELQDVLHYFRREASALERATIASNDAVYSQYRQLCTDHYLERLRPFEIAIAVTSATALIGAFVALTLLY